MIPAPVETATTTDEYVITSATELGYHGAEAQEIVEYLAGLLRTHSTRTEADSDYSR